jgi:hypothetical protein
VFTTATPAVCTAGGNNGTTITLAGGGTCTVNANQDATDLYAAATTVSQSFTVKQASQTITFAALAPRTLGDPPFTVAATGGASGQPVKFYSWDPDVCTSGGTNGATITLVRVGQCGVGATQSGNANYLPAPTVSQSFAIGKGSQVIAFPAIPDKKLADSPVTVSATGGATSNPVVFTTTTPSVCMANGTNGATITLLAAGTCTVAGAGTATTAGATGATTAGSTTADETTSGAGQAPRVAPVGVTESRSAWASRSAMSCAW